MTWGTPVEIERRRRIRISLWAYAYELQNESIVSDEVFDRECKLVDLSISTGRADLDAWFRKHFTPSSGMWVRRHPELAKLSALWRRTRLISPGPTSEFDDLLG